MPNPIDNGAEFSYEDADNMLLLIGRQDNDDVYISVQDREPVNLPPDVAVEVAKAILSRAGVAADDLSAIADLIAYLRQPGSKQ